MLEDGNIEKNSLFLGDNLFLGGEEPYSRLWEQF
jgi:hypothetical protein